MEFCEQKSFFSTNEILFFYWLWPFKRGWDPGKNLVLFAVITFLQVSSPAKCGSRRWHGKKQHGSHRHQFRQQFHNSTTKTEKVLDQRFPRKNGTCACHVYLIQNGQISYIYIYIYRKQRVPDIWRTSNQSKIEHRWVRTNPTNQGRIYDYVFSSNRKKVNSLFFPFMATLKKHIAPGFFMKRRGKRSSGISFSFVFVRTELGFAFAKLVPALDHEARVSQENSQWKTPVNHLPYSGPRTPTPP